MKRFLIVMVFSVLILFANFPVAAQNAEQEWLGDVAWSPDGNVLVLAGASGVWIYDAHDLAAAPHLLEGPQWGFSSVAFNSDGELLAAGSWSGPIWIWDTNTLGLAHILEGHQGIVIDVEFSPMGSVLASAGGFIERIGTLRLWDVETEKLLADLNDDIERVYEVAFNPDGTKVIGAGSKTILTWTKVPVAQMWDVTNGEHLREFRYYSEGDYYAVDFAPDGMMFAVGGDEIWHGDSPPTVEGSPAKTVSLWNIQADDDAPLMLRGHTADIQSITFNPSGTLLAVACDDGAVWVWDVAERSPLYVVQEHETPAERVAFSPDGSQLAILYDLYDEMLVQLWDMDAWELISTIQPHPM